MRLRDYMIKREVSEWEVMLAPSAQALLLAEQLMPDILGCFNNLSFWYISAVDNLKLEEIYIQFPLQPLLNEFKG